MAVQTEKDEDIVFKNGMSRKVEEGNDRRLLNILNGSLYIHPIKSAIRELVSNASDAIAEKRFAIDVINGKKKISDKYIDRVDKDDPQYKHSEFDIDYYDLNWLDSKNEINIEYVEGNGISGEVDTISIKDTGVGLSDKEGISGKPRIIGIHNSLYSTKRNNHNSFGAFGLGAKSVIAIDSSHYIIETAYNGHRYRLKCWKYKVASDIGPINLVTGQKNKALTWGDITIYGEPTTSKNYTEFIIPSKIHQREPYINAIKEQLLYMNNVKFYYTKLNESKKEIPFLGNKIYESKNIIISSNSLFTRPHILIIKDNIEVGQVAHDDAICYGLIKFDELEMENYGGQIGIKCHIRSTINDENDNEIVLKDGVQVIQSRESVIFNEITAQYLKKRINEDILTETSDYVSNRIKSDDFYEFIKAVTTINGAVNSINDPLYHLSKMTNLTNICTKFKDLKINRIIGQKLISGYKVKGDKEKIITIESLLHWSELIDTPIYLDTEGKPYSKKKNVYIYKELENRQPFIVITLTDEDRELARKNANSSFSEDIVNKVKVVDYLLASKSLTLLKYNNVVVPEEYVMTSEVEQEQEVIKEKEKTLTPQELRKLNEEVIVDKITVKNYPGLYDIPYDFKKVTIKLSELLNFGLNTRTENSVCYYGTQENKQELLLAAAITTQPHEYSKYSRGFVHNKSDKTNDILWTDSNNGVRFMCVAKNILPKLKGLVNYKPIEDFFHIISEKDNMFSLSTAQELIDYNTCIYLSKNMPILEFMYNYSDIDEDIHNKYHILLKYYEVNYDKNAFNKHYSGFFTQQTMQTLQENLLLLGQSQLELRGILNITDETAQKESRQLILDRFGISENKELQVFGYNLAMIDLQKDLLAYAENISSLLNTVFPLRNDAQLEFDLVKEIKLYINCKKSK